MYAYYKKCILDRIIISQIVQYSASCINVVTIKAHGFLSGHHSNTQNDNVLDLDRHDKSCK